MTNTVQLNSTVSHSAFLIECIPKLNDSNSVDWNLGLKTYLKGRQLWKYVSREVVLSSEDAEDPDKGEALESERASVLEVIRATVTLTRLPVIRGIEDPKLAYETLIDRVSQDNGVEVAALIAQVATIRYQGNESVSIFLDNINDLHTKLSEATSQDPDLCISDKLLAVFLLMSFPGENYSTIRDQLFGDLKSLTTSKVISRIKTKTALSSADESATAMAASASRPVPNTNHPSRTVRTNKSPNAPCVLREHSRYPHTNGECSRQQQMAATKSKPQSSAISNEEKVRRYNQLASLGIISFNTQAEVTAPKPTTVQTNQKEQAPDPYCQFATSYNAQAQERSSPTTSSTDPAVEVMLSLSRPYPQPQTRNGLKPTFAETACNRHMYGDVLLLEDIREIPPVWI